MDLSFLLNWDLILFYLINTSFNNEILTLIAKFISFLGTRVFLLIILFFIYILGSKEDEEIVILSLLSFFIAIILVTFLKEAIARPRPYIILDNINFLSTERGYSFPSGHSALSFAVYIILGYKYNKLTIAIILSSIIAISRVYLGVHYPTDIISGAFLGSIIAVIIIKLGDITIDSLEKLLNKD